jgi:hypothetical protein
MDDYSSFLAIMESLSEVKTIEGKRVIIKAAFEIIRVLTQEIKFLECRNNLETRILYKVIESKNIRLGELEEQNRKRHRQDEDVADSMDLDIGIDVVAFEHDNRLEHDQKEEYHPLTESN